MRMQREDMQNRVPGRILSATTLHGLLLVLGFVHYTLLGGEGLADYASEREGGVFVIGLSVVAFLCFVGAYARRFQLVALSVTMLATTLAWATLSDEGRVALSEPLTLAALISTLFGMWLLLLRLRAVRTDDAREAAMRERRLKHRVSGRLQEPLTDAVIVQRDSHIDAVPWITGTAAALWMILPLLVLGFAHWSGVVLVPEREILGIVAGTTFAIISVYVVVLEPMLYVRDVPSQMGPKRLVGVVSLVLITSCSLAAGWAILTGTPNG